MERMIRRRSNGLTVGAGFVVGGANAEFVILEPTAMAGAQLGENNPRLTRKKVLGRTDPGRSNAQDAIESHISNGFRHNSRERRKSDPSIRLRFAAS